MNLLFGSQSLLCNTEMTPSKRRRPGCFHDEFEWDGDSTHSGGSSRESSPERSYDYDAPLASNRAYARSAASLPVMPSLKTLNNVGHGHGGRGLEEPEGWMSPGDILCFLNEDQMQQTSGLLRIGAAGGFFGHVLVIVRQPQRVYWGSEDSYLIGDMWPHDAEYVWRVGTIESTRENDGLHDADLLLHVEASTGRLLLLAEINKDEVQLASRQPAELWRTPAELQRGFRADLMREVLSDMKASEGNWSYATAALAFLSGPGSRHRADSPGALEEIQDSWEARPICTSVVVTFWQRYLHKLAGALAPQADAAALIIDWMPLRADRILPGELKTCMIEQGWELTRAPMY